MTAHNRTLAAAIIAGTAMMTAIVVAQGPAPAPQAPPAGQTTQPPADGRGGGPGAAAGGRGAVQGARRGGFPQFTRPLPSQETILRGKALYDTNCARCHAPDLRGAAEGTNIIRSGLVFRDENGEVLRPALQRHRAPINLNVEDSAAVAAFLHSIQATMGGQGSPPGRGANAATLNILVGDAKAGEGKFQRFCSKCHSVTGDLAAANTKYGDARALQNAWVAGSGGRFGGGGGGGRGGAAASAGTVTLANGTKLQGTIQRVDDFLVVITLADGTRRSMARVNGVPRVDVVDPQAAHKAMVLEIDDANNQNMYDITAYLATIK
jgi:cytochrome c oxidase cbb3-type subunit 3